jgi:hypothetical protein
MWRAPPRVTSGAGIGVGAPGWGPQECMTTHRIRGSRPGGQFQELVFKVHRHPPSRGQWDANSRCSRPLTRSPSNLQGSPRLFAGHTDAMASKVRYWDLICHILSILHPHLSPPPSHSPWSPRFSTRWSSSLRRATRPPLPRRTPFADYMEDTLSLVRLEAQERAELSTGKPYERSIP